MAVVPMFTGEEVDTFAKELELQGVMTQDWEENYLIETESTERQIQFRGDVLERIFLRYVVYSIENSRDGLTGDDFSESVMEYLYTAAEILSFTRGTDEEDNVEPVTKVPRNLSALAS